MELATSSMTLKFGPYLVDFHAGELEFKNGCQNPFAGKSVEGTGNFSSNDTANSLRARNSRSTSGPTTRL